MSKFFRRAIAPLTWPLVMLVMVVCAWLWRGRRVTRTVRDRTFAAVL